jgi:hypothetical protein
MDDNNRVGLWASKLDVVFEWVAGRAGGARRRGSDPGQWAFSQARA